MKLKIVLPMLLAVALAAVIATGCNGIGDLEGLVDEAEEAVGNVTDVVDEVSEKVDEITEKVEEITGTGGGEDTGTPGTPVSGSGADIPMNSSAWVKINTGEWEETTEGLRVYGAGYREGHQGLQSRQVFNFLGTETRITWQADGGNGEYGAFWIFLMSDYVPETAENSGLVRGGYFTTDHSYKESVVISPVTWYYTRILVDADGMYTVVTASGDYDDMGGSVIYTGQGEYENAENGTIVAIFQDNYGGTDTWIMVGEAKTAASTASTGMPEPPDEPEVLEPQEEGTKMIVIYPQDDVTNAMLNGEPVITGTENQIKINTNHPLVVTFTYTDDYGRVSQAEYDLDTYYDFHVLKSNGGWASTIHREEFNEDKTSS